jgi:hypothetical protein
VKSGAGTSATSRHRSDSGGESTATVPSLNGFFKAMRTRPSGPGRSRSLASGGRKMYLSRASRPLSSKAPARVAAWQAEAGFGEGRFDDDAGSAREGELARFAT